ncbi:S8 family serine peptidase [Paracraurococcus lichenis]|uniref:S8 family serine peptidase n=1 Tax=Paracraurococcus lichenis TaxID=3064888 RepID=A0ABT9E7Y1_9PROT|nr:S8 family serine peptidase [Paracraurococcus sp. LOR1-02]MDO9712316.1 S8 family serine peptidase [Paracraurococcus sp. LOR1-02]
MSDQKDSPGPRDRRGSPAHAAAPGASATGSAADQPTHKTTPHADVGTRRRQYMVGRAVPTAEAYAAGFAPAAAGFGLGPQVQAGGSYNADEIVRALGAMPDVEVVRRVRPTGVGVLSAGAANHDIVVVRTATLEKAEFLETMGRRNPSLIVERDHLLQHLGTFRPAFVGLPGTPTQAATASIDVEFRVTSQDGNGLQNAEVVVYGENGTEDRGKTDANGNVTIQVRGGFLNQTAALYVKPAANHWEKFIERPSLQQNGVNTIPLRALSDFPEADFPAPNNQRNAFFGYGQRIMDLLGLDLAACTGAGARVAIIDSGCDADHPALRHIRIGRDYTNLSDDHQPDENSWRDDQISHGTHCAGIIAGNGQNGHIRGFAPEAEVHILKVFPGGAFNNLVAAIHYCIDNAIHVVNCSLGSDADSRLVQQAIELGRQAGVAVFVAAGNSASAVQFPARLPGVMCVSAIGQAGRVPEDTYHARTVPDGAPVAPGQVYPARFTCHGPQVGLCGPGVGIISTVPGGGYAAWDGTSMADPHLTGLGALLAAHHPALNRAVVRDAAWVDHLFALMRSAAAPVGLPAEFGGVGLPQASRAIGAGTAMAGMRLSGASPTLQAGPDSGMALRGPEALAEAVSRAVLRLLPEYMKDSIQDTRRDPGRTAA